MIVHGIIGCGRVAPNHADAFRRRVDCQLKWACDLDGDLARTFAAEHGIGAVATDYRELLADPDLVSVSVAVGHAAHASIVEDALHAGKHVLVEKPVALSLATARRLRDCALERGVRLEVVAQHRFDPLVMRVKQWVDGGLLGRLVMLNATLQCARPADYYRDTWRGRWSSEGGSALINQGYHYIDLLSHLGGGIREARACMDTIVLGDAIETEDTLCAAVRYGCGALGTLSVTVGASVAWRSRVDVVGSEGSLSFDLDHPDTLHFAHGSQALLDAVAAFQREPRAEEPPAGLDYYGISHRHQVARFCDAIVLDRATSDPATGVETLEAIALLYDAAAQAMPRRPAEEWWRC